MLCRVYRLMGRRVGLDGLTTIIPPSPQDFLTNSARATVVKKTASLLSSRVRRSDLSSIAFRPGSSCQGPYSLIHGSVAMTNKKKARRRRRDLCY